MSRTYALNFFGGRACRFMEIGSDTRRDIAKGARVTLPPNCRGTVALTSEAGTGGMPAAPADPANRIVGRFRHAL